MFTRGYPFIPKVFLRVNLRRNPQIDRKVLTLAITGETYLKKKNIIKDLKLYIYIYIYNIYHHLLLVKHIDTSKTL